MKFTWRWLGLVVAVLAMLVVFSSAPLAGQQADDPNNPGRPPRPRDGNNDGPPGPGKGGPPGRGRPDGPPGGGPGGGRRGPSGKVITEHTLKDLWIPPLLTGPNYNLTLAAGTMKYAETATPTLGYNGANFMGPTLVFNQGEKVQINFKNNYTEPTTVHWHGLHLPALTDGGPHQVIAAGATWTPSWIVKNNAGTYWYHPHPHETTQKQMALGATGLIIIRDAEEAKLALPRTYGVDDIPLVLTSRRFNNSNQFTYAGDNDKYGDYGLVNGVMDAQTKLPAQWVRLRILNAEIERGYILGFSDQRPFYLITTDGGLVDKPIPLKRIRLMVGERAEILVDLSADKPGSSFDLMAYNSNQSFGFPGGEPDQGGANGSLLNNKDFRVLHCLVSNATNPRITQLPATLKTNRFPVAAEASAKRQISVTDGRPFFKFDGKSFDMHQNNFVVKLGATETWTITNNNIFGHSFHVHDVQFKIIARSDGTVPEFEQGWKDTAYLPRGGWVTFVAKFEDFASDTDPFMYHCHMANHEDGGMMGQFLVSANPEGIKREKDGTIRFRAQTEHPLTAQLIKVAAQLTQTQAAPFSWQDAQGRTVTNTSYAAGQPLLLYFIEKECPCSRDAAVFINQLQQAYAGSAKVLGVINADDATAATWTQTVGPNFPVIADPDGNVSTAYRAERSAGTVLVAPNGLITKANPGYSARILQELSASLAQLGRTTNKKLSFTGAPTELTSGCPLK